jgi:hypothetical protein
VKNGYFDQMAIEKHATVLQARIMATKADGSLEAAWSTYHDSFASNASEVVDQLYSSFKQHFKHITPINLNGTIKLLKDLNHADLATELIEMYVSGREENRLLFDLSLSPFGDQVNDPEVRMAFQEKLKTLHKEEDFRDVLLRMNHNWTHEKMSVLAGAPIAAYVAAFLETTGGDLRTMISNALQFDRVGNADPNMKEVSKRARAALAQIGSMSPLNARRVSKYGIDPADFEAKNKA